MSAKRVLATLAVLGTAAFGLAACSTDAPVPETVTVTHTVTQAPLPNPKQPDTGTEKFLADVHNEKPEATVATDDELVTFGENVCAAFDAGATLNDVINVIAEGAPNTAAAQVLGYVMGVAVRDLCPEYTALVIGGVA